jgi:hypothetical protein
MRFKPGRINVLKIHWRRDYRIKKEEKKENYLLKFSPSRPYSPQPSLGPWKKKNLPPFVAWFFRRLLPRFSLSRAQIFLPPSPAFSSSDRSFFFLTRTALLSLCTRLVHSSAQSFPCTLLPAEVSPSSPGRCVAPSASSPSFCPLPTLFLKSCQPPLPPPGGAELLPLAWIRPSFSGSWPRWEHLERGK